MGIAVFVAMGCGGGGEKSVDAAIVDARKGEGLVDGGRGDARAVDATATVDAGLPSKSTLTIRSFPASGAAVGQAFRYQVMLSETGMPVYHILKGPEGATIDMNGNLRWTPSEAQAGLPHDFAVKATLHGGTAEQRFRVAVTKRAEAAREEVKASAQGTSVVEVRSPISPIQGAAVLVPKGALPQGAVLQISEVSGLPPLPAAQVLMGGMAAAAAVDFGPSGLVFQKPVRLTLPLSDAVVEKAKGDRSQIQAWTLNSSQGIWERLPVVDVNMKSQIAVVETVHFSDFAAIAAPAFLTRPKVTAGGKSCPTSVFAQAQLALGAKDVRSEWFNGYEPGTDADTLAAVLASLGQGTSVVLLLDAVLSDASSAVLGERRLVTTIRRGEGGLDLTVLRDGLEVLTREDLAPEAVAALLGARPVHFVFSGAATAAGSVTVRAYGYLMDDEGLPSSLGKPFGEEQLSFGTLAVGEEDDDCDALLDDADPTPHGAVPPSLVGPDRIRTLAGQEAALEVVVAPAEATVEWIATDGTLTPSGSAATFVASEPGTYEITAIAHHQGEEAAYRILVTAEMPTTNTPPSCALVADTLTIFVGESLGILAFGEDAEQAPDLVQFDLRASGGLLVPSGDHAIFQASAPEVYTIGCTASDGVAKGAETTLEIAVIEKPENVPPEIVYLLPMVTTLEKGMDGVASTDLVVAAYDPDDAEVRFVFDVVEGTAEVKPVVEYADSQWLTMSAAVVGGHRILVTAVDGHGARSLPLDVSFFVVDAPLGDIDADGDGFPAGYDCADVAPSIYPGAPEVCADDVDQNCDGEDTGAADCDVDLDGWTIRDGDCDNLDVTVNPWAWELCDGLDNNCNGDVDEWFGYWLGTDCTSGYGPCERAGVNVCSPDGWSVVCSAEPGVPQEETCNGEDDDCDGWADNIYGVGGDTIEACGLCRMACVPDGVNMVATCQPDWYWGIYGCGFACAENFWDYDGLPGCEVYCKPAEEICDGIDNDCNGWIDEWADRYIYTGPEGTAWVGRCQAGWSYCDAGYLVPLWGEVTPVPEECNGMDDDCDGLSDEDLDCTVLDPSCAVGCWDGSCAPSYLLCPCAPATPVKCPDGMCVGAVAECDLGMMSSNLVVCWDGTSVATYEECPLAPWMEACSDGTFAPAGSCGSAAACAIVCSDGRCVDDTAACDCPVWSSVKCADGTCVASPDLCGTMGVVLCDGVECPTGGCAPTPAECPCPYYEPFKCESGMCVVDPADCAVGGPVCTGFVCENGSCVTNIADCGCPSWAPFQCVDARCVGAPEECGGTGPLCVGVTCESGDCVQSYDLCPCPSWTPYKCPDGSCVGDTAGCAGGTACTGVFCDDGSCVASSAECPCALGAQKCPDGTCVTDLSACYGGTPGCSGVSCPDGTCAADLSGCPCATGLVKCTDGTCASDAPSCPCAQGQQKCADGTCVTDVSACQATVGCGGGVSCADGSCAASVADCPCASGMGKCPDGTTCVSDPYTQCAGQKSCAPGTYVCPDQVTCVTDPATQCAGTSACSPGTTLCPDGVTCVADPTTQCQAATPPI
jgi:hypothetical protein